MSKQAAVNSFSSKNRYRVGIIGGGSWGTAVGQRLALVGHQVEIWAHSPAVVAAINNRHENYHLPGITLPPNLAASNDLQQVAGAKDYLFIATPSLHTLEIVKELILVRDVLEGQTPIGVLTKGFVATPRGPKLILQAIEDYLPGSYKHNLVFISGPSHAEEVSRGKLTGLIAASANPMNSIRFRALLSVQPLMVFSSLDIIGVQVAAAVKNIIALAFGMMDALKERSKQIGDNTESLLLAAGLNEIQILAVALGCTRVESISSIAGVGDLDVTCRSPHGRNRRFGREIVLKDALQSFHDIDDLHNNFDRIGYLPEGAVAARFVAEYAEQLNLKLPISLSVYRILNRQTTPLNEINRFLQSLHRGGLATVT